MRPTLVAFLAVFVLGACAGGVRPPEAARFDLGAIAIVWRPATLTLAGVTVVAPSWLGSSAMAYRLLYADPLRRLVYGESRWTAPPAELVERALNRHVDPAGGGCRLRLDLDELVQIFDSPQASRALIEVRAGLVTPNRDRVLARRAFAVTRPAPSTDARGGVAATAAALGGLGGELQTWLAEVASETPELALACRAG